MRSITLTVISPSGRIIATGSVTPFADTAEDFELELTGKRMGVERPGGNEYLFGRYEILFGEERHGPQKAAAW